MVDDRVLDPDLLDCSCSKRELHDSLKDVCGMEDKVTLVLGACDRHVEDKHAVKEFAHSNALRDQDEGITGREERRR